MLYEGDIMDRQPHGVGILKDPKSRLEMTGTFILGQLRGEGHLTTAGGNQYRGEFLDSLFHGQGTYEWIDGTKYEGAFLKGKLVAADGRIREGEWDMGRETTRKKKKFSEKKKETIIFGTYFALAFAHLLLLADIAVSSWNQQ